LVRLVLRLRLRGGLRARRRRRLLVDLLRRRLVLLQLRVGRRRRGLLRARGVLLDLLLQRARCLLTCCSTFAIAASRVGWPSFVFVPAPALCGALIAGGWMFAS